MGNSCRKVTPYTNRESHKVGLAPILTVGATSPIVLQHTSVSPVSSNLSVKRTRRASILISSEDHVKIMEEIAFLMTLDSQQNQAYNRTQLENTHRD